MRTSMPLSYIHRFLGFFLIVLTLGADAEPMSAPNGEKALSPEEFKNPPLTAKPRAYWDWTNGAVDLDQLTRDLEEMKDKGMGGAEMWDTAALRNPGGFVPDGPPFLGPESLEAIHHCLQEAKRLGLELGLVASSGWNAGGAWVTPEFAGKNIYWSTIQVDGPKKISVEIPLPELPKNCPRKANGEPAYLREVAILALPLDGGQTIESTDQAIDLSRSFKDGNLHWEAPKGNWAVHRYVLTNNGQQLIAGSPNSTGPFLDYLDPEATEMHFHYILDKLGMTPEETKESALVSMEVDSMELERGIQWTLRFPEFFTEQYGYDPRPWLPALSGWTIQDQETTQRFIDDYHNAISDLLIESHYRTASHILNEYGLDLVAEAGGPGPPIWDTCPVDAIKALGAVDIPRGEFWIRHRNMFLIKEIASAAHVYGKTFVDAESFTTWRRWMDSPFVVKPYADRAFCEGLNRITFHGFSHSPPEAGFPGRTYHAGYDLNPRVTWWPMARPFIDYLARCSHLLQQGKSAADVCYYYGDQAPNFFPKFHDVPAKPRLPGLSEGYDYDVIDTQALVERLSVEDEHLVLPDGVQYELLLLPDSETMPLPVLEKIHDLVQAGATILGPSPKTLPGLSNSTEDFARMKELVPKVWNSSNSHVHSDSTANTVLQEQGVEPDFEFRIQNGSGEMDWIHRKVGLTEVYFIRNESVNWIDSVCSFRVTGKIPSLWSPDTGEVSPCLEYVENDHRTDARIVLPPWGSVFVVFETKEESPHLAEVFRPEDRSLPGNAPSVFVDSVDPNTVTLRVRSNGDCRMVDPRGREKAIQVSDVPVSVEVAGPWNVSFTEGWGAPPEKVFEEIRSWTDFEEEGIKYYSGTATYRKEIQIPEALLSEGQALCLDLGDVRDLARVRLNGEDLGILWKIPFEVEITQIAKRGANQLEIEVVNQWINRLAGDLRLPPEERFCRTNQTPFFKSIGGDEAWRIQPAGLLGPVELVPERLVEVEVDGFSASSEK